MRKGIVLCAVLIFTTALAGCGFDKETVSNAVSVESSISSSEKQNTISTEEKKNESSVSEDGSVSEDKSDNEEAEVHEGVTVNISKEYSKIVCSFFEAYMAGDEYIPETSNSAFPYSRADPGYFLCLDTNGDGYDEVFVCGYCDDNNWEMLGHELNSDGRNDLFSHFNSDQNQLSYKSSSVGRDEAYENYQTIDFYSLSIYEGGWSDLHLMERYMKESVFEDENGNELDETLVLECSLYKDGNNSVISLEEYEKAYNSPQIELSTFSDRIFRITPANIETYLKVE